MTGWQRIAGGVLGGILCMAAFGAAGLWASLYLPMSGTQPTKFTVHSGQSLYAVTEELENAGLIRWKEPVYWYVRLRNLPLRAGEFSLAPGLRPYEICAVLAYGRPVLHRVHFSEGRTLIEIAQAVGRSGLASSQDVLALSHNQTFLHQEDIPAQSVEGYLFPETYFFSRTPDQNPRPLIQGFIDGFRKVTNRLPEAKNTTALHNLVILASLVEKETAVPEERRRVAGVYANRLRRGMLLQCDPTVIYGLGSRFTGNLRRVHLKDPENPYNTYIHPGLPPGPICSPGKAALLAAANPEKHEYLYFVGKGDGTHYFSRSLSEHNRAVVKYQRCGRPLKR